MDGFCFYCCKVFVTLNPLNAKAYRELLKEIFGDKKKSMQNEFRKYLANIFSARIA